LNISSGVHRWGGPVREIESVDVGQIDAEEFRTEFVDKCKPLLIRSATNHWPAAKRWSTANYLDQLLRGRPISVHREPVLEMRWRRKHWPDRFRKAFDAQSPEVMPCEKLMELAASNEFVFAYAVGIDNSTSLSVLEDDIGEFEFLVDAAQSNYYEPLRAFVHGVSYTDWHMHPDDETLMCQFGRGKTVNMLPPDESTWNVIIDIAERENHIGPASPDQYQRLKTLEPLVGEVQPGDAVYIPPNWWHAVQCNEESTQLGVTVAYCWGSPKHIRFDPRFPFRRFFLRRGDWKRRLKLAAAATMWGALALAGKSQRSVPGRNQTTG